MMRNKTRLTLFITLLVVAALAAGFGTAFATMLPLRGGTVLASTKTPIATYIQAKDDQGKEFWIVTAACTVGQGGKVDVMVGSHYDRIESKTLNKVLDDAYIAQVIRVQGEELKGFSAHGLPEGCIDLGK
jgi:hypothetical protein